MPLDIKEFAAKLSRYRSQFDASLDDVANATGLSSGTLSALEAAQRAPTGDEVLILADYFMCDYKFFISNERLTAFEQTEKLFRKHGTALTPSDRWAIQEFLYLCECEAFLQGALGRPAAHTFTFTKAGTYYKGHGEAAALALRRHLRYAPHEIPTDVFRDFREIGVHMFRRRMNNSGISGLYVRHPTAGKCVLVNYSEDVFRQRFTAAHEGGHSILDDEEDFVVSFWNEGDLVETRANTFAAHFVLPPEYVKRLPATAWDEASILDTAKSLYVNVDTLLIALQREGLMSADRAADLRHLKVPRDAKRDPELSTSLSDGARARKEALLQRGLSGAYVRMCLDAYENEIVSANRVAEMLLVDEGGLAEIGALFGWTPKHDS
jgi:Zn-dependent peptidase ImmA (M78 family)/transcriptional regulator with XRE-family HTH domain